MFGRKNKEEEVNRVIVDQYDRKWCELSREGDTVRGWAQAVKWYGLPLEVFIKDSAEYKAALMEVHDAQLRLRNAMGAYDASRHEFIKWVENHFDELPTNYQRYGDPATSTDLVRYALDDILRYGYAHFKRPAQKN